MSRHTHSTNRSDNQFGMDQRKREIEKTDEEKKEEVVKSCKAFMDECDGYHEFAGPGDHPHRKDWQKARRWLGFVIHTNKQIIRVLLENGEKCCSHYRAYTTTNTNTPFNPETFLVPGTVIQSVRMLEKASHREHWYDDIRNELSVEIRTKGKPLLRLVLQCEQSGFYPRDTYVEWDGFKDDTQEL